MTFQTNSLELVFILLSLILPSNSSNDIADMQKSEENGKNFYFPGASSIGKARATTRFHLEAL